MEQELLQDIKDYLGSDYDEEQESTLLFCIKKAIRSFKNKRNYPDSYTEKMVNADMDKFYMCIFDLALYAATMQGFEFEASHSENGTNRSWKNESDIYSVHNVIPISIFI